MCGVAGVVLLGEGQPPEREALARMATALIHRGPDELGLYRDARAGLCHTRLSIVDLATGQQPLSNEDDSLYISFNGEVFNYVELRAELVALGHRFRTHGDTEVIVHAYEAWGEDCFARFNGQFAIALWDRMRRRMVLARDRLGVRPLHLCAHQGRLWFASEAKAIFAAERSIPRALDPLGIDEAFTFWAPLAPRTPFVGITELPPGHLMVVEEGRTSTRAWYTPSFPIGGEGFSGSLRDATQAVRAALETAVKLRIVRADVPVGSYLSGGLDSSLVAAMGLGCKGDRFSTFSLRFDDAEYDETPYQRMMSARLGSDHHELTISRRDIAAAFPAVVRHTERPLLRTAPAPLYLLSQRVKEAGIKVVLTGEGADEIFAGYDLFREAKVRRFWARQPGSKLRPRLLEKLYPYLARSPVSQRAMAQKFFGRNLANAAAPGFSHELRWSSAHALTRLFDPGTTAAIGGRNAVDELLRALPAEFSRWTPLAQDQYLEIRTLLSSYILCSQGDRMLMAHGVEGRFPFLDPNVVALAASLPPSYKLDVLDEKHVLKCVAEDLVPAAIVRRKKQPYRAPDAISFIGADRPAWVDEVLAPDSVRDAGIFSVSTVEALWNKCRGRADESQLSNADNMALVGVLSTQLLHREVLGAALPAPAAHFRTLLEAS